MELTTQELADLIEDYAEAIVDSLEYDVVLALLKSSIIDRLVSMDEADVIAEIQESAPELLEEDSEENSEEDLTSEG